MRYAATLVAEYTIEAENIVEARRVARRIRSIGEVYGSRRVVDNDRDPSRYRVALEQETVRVRRAVDAPQETKR
jgi:hypothetical protein